VTRTLRVVAVCMGNICRSPTAEAVLRAKLIQAGLGDRVEVDSAGTYGGHVGEPPDPRSQEAAARRGYDLSALRARRLAPSDAEADLVLVMDRGNLRRAAQVVGEHAGLSLFLGNEAGGAEVPDPYGGGRDGFERVLDMIEQGADAWVARIAARLEAASDTKAPPGGSGT
jgi:protein-tyrosine phosphatase